MIQETRRRIVGIVLLSWLSMLGFDFLLHGGLLAKLYSEPSPFLLPPGRAFSLIPLGYLSFLIAAVLVVWLQVRLGRRGWRSGTLFGLKFGALVWGSTALGLLSISSARPVLLLAWFAGQTIETGIAGAVAGEGLANGRLGRLLVYVVVFVLVAVALTIVLQNTGLAPAAELPG